MSMKNAESSKILESLSCWQQYFQIALNKKPNLSTKPDITLKKWANQFVPLHFDSLT